MTEEQLVKALGRGELSALEALMDRYAPYVSSVVSRILRGRRADVEELTADVFLAAWDSRDKLRPGKVKGWLGAVARLDRPQRELFVRHYYYGQTVREAALAMGLNLSTAKTWLRRGRETLKTILEQEGYGHETAGDLQADG